MRNIIIEINGGIGKSIMATAVISNIKLQYPDDKILVITAYPAVFLNNPDIYRVFQFGNCPYFYNDYIKDKDVLFLCAEPYRSHGYLKQDMHLIESWCNEIGITPNTLEPKLYINQREISLVQNKITHQKPMLVFQPFGGPTNKGIPYSWNRDIPPKQAQEIANILSDTYTIIQPVTDNQIKLNNCIHLTTNFRELFCYVKLANKIIGIDSCVQHAAKALNKHANVCWITNKPKIFGYESHTNIFCKEYDNKEIIDSYLLEYDFSGNRLYDYPFEDDNVFNITEIIERVNNDIF